jgi:hypothetical protein
MGTPSHASLTAGAAPATSDPTTGEVRVPLDLWAVDIPLGTTALVLSRVEAERLHARITYLMDRPVETPQRGHA